MSNDNFIALYNQTSHTPITDISFLEPRYMDEQFFFDKFFLDKII